jgi:hypothetical protein
MSAERYCGRKQSQAIQKVERLVQIQRAWQREIYVQPAVSLIRRYDVAIDREHHMHCIDTCTLRGRKLTLEQSEQAIPRLPNGSTRCEDRVQD